MPRWQQILAPWPSSKLFWCNREALEISLCAYECVWCPSRSLRFFNLCLARFGVDNQQSFSPMQDTSPWRVFRVHPIDGRERMVFLESSCLLTVWTTEIVRAFTVLGSRRFCPVSLLCDGCAAACNSTSCNQTTHNQSKALSHVFASRVSFNFDKWQSARWQRDSEPLNFSILIIQIQKSISYRLNMQNL